MRPEIKLFIDEYINAFTELDISGVDALVLFGSQARGTATLLSDVDIAVIMRNNLTPRDRGIMLSLGEDIDMRIETNLFFTTQQALDNAERDLDTNTSIKKEGIILWQR